MKYTIVYIVMCEGEVKYASESSEDAKSYGKALLNLEGNSVLREWGDDDPNLEDCGRARYQAGYEDDYEGAIKVDMSNEDEDGMIRLPDGGTVDGEEIREKLRENDISYIQKVRQWEAEEEEREKWDDFWNRRAAEAQYS